MGAEERILLEMRELLFWEEMAETVFLRSPQEVQVSEGWPPCQGRMALAEGEEEEEDALAMEEMEDL